MRNKRGWRIHDSRGKDDWRARRDKADTEATAPKTARTTNEKRIVVMRGNERWVLKDSFQSITRQYLYRTRT